MRIFIRYFKFHLPQFYQILQRKFIAVSKNFFFTTSMMILLSFSTISFRLKLFPLILFAEFFPRHKLYMRSANLSRPYSDLFSSEASHYNF